MKDIDKLIEIVFTLSRMTKEGFEDKDNSLSYIQFQTLSFLLKYNSPTMREISEYTHITAPSTTILINNLVRMKLVLRIHDEFDRRLIRLIITTSGKEELEKGVLAVKKHLKNVFSKLSKKDRHDFMRVLIKLSNFFNQVVP
ncbi:MAG: MarR family transcriptional regulator [uncultured bacterium]|nr:MAG: MarR family transcriptional regulator [uncultured bacterium]OGH90910.1 MAG: hypothetical protein A2507_00605 [Candidatus Magasanikbacteria bacterium RIFOXYD12_FULL_33_17]HAO51873.1 hypothetical protein [Candidatus Magasanikbacteria bacterium]